MQFGTLVIACCALLVLLATLNIGFGYHFHFNFPDALTHLEQRQQLGGVPVTRVSRALRLESDMASGTLLQRSGSSLATPALTPDPRQHDAQRHKYHVLVTADSSVYAQWQVRICYYYYLKMKKEHPDSAMGGFTRLIHDGNHGQDRLVNDIPTVIVDPLPPGVDGGYVVLHRPYGILQWVRKYMRRLPEDFIFMSEPDHLYLRPPPQWATPTKPAAFPFFYIEPKVEEKVVNKFNGRNVSIDEIDPVGSSPVIIHKDQLEQIAPLWYNLSLAVKRDPEADKAFGWVQEMYAYAIASSQVEGGPVRYALKPEFMLQTPWDEAFTAPANGKLAFMLHYTYGQDIDAQGNHLPDKVGPWHWDKRDYENRYPPRNYTLPDPCHVPTVTKLIEMINEATAAIEPWEQVGGW